MTEFLLLGELTLNSQNDLVKLFLTSFASGHNFYTEHQALTKIIDCAKVTKIKSKCIHTVFEDEDIMQPVHAGIVFMCHLGLSKSENENNRWTRKILCIK